MKDIMELCDVVRETGFAIHRYHRHGHLEKVYENALAHRLRKLGLDVKQQHPLKVYDEDGNQFLRLLRLFAAYSTPGSEPRAFTPAC
jgi:GxxExxY protein